MNEHDETNFSLSSKEGTMSYDNNYKVINSARMADAVQPDKMPKPPWVFEGSNWQQNDDLQWVPPKDTKAILHQHHPDTMQSINQLQQKLSSDMTIILEQETNSTIIAATNASTSLTPSSKIEVQQSDTGANTSATNNISLLHDIVYIKPISINSAAKGSPMQMLAVGRIHLHTTTGDTISPLCYYSPEIDGTIISPTAIVHEFDHIFKGFSKICDCEKNKGYLSLDAHAEEKSVIIPLVSYNKLWYHDVGELTQMNPTPVVNKLSQAASYELWHQRFVR